MAEFAIGAAVTGTLSALYFYPYFLLQIPLGVLIDRWGARLLLTGALSVAGLGSVLFASASTIEIAYLGRFLIGVGSAVGFLGSLAIAAKWFRPDQFAFLAGMVMLFGMMSGVFAQGPLAALVIEFGWRPALWGLGLSGIALALLIFLIVRDSPADGDTLKPAKDSWAQTWKNFCKAVSSKTVWKIAFLAAAMSGPMLTIGGLWGVPYLQSAYGLDKTSAAATTSFILFGWAVCAPFAGWFSDRIKKRKPLLVSGSFALSCILAILIFANNLPLFVTIILFALIGSTGAFMSITFALVREVSAPHISASVTGIVNSMTVASGALLQPVVGLILDSVWSGEMRNDIPVYEAGDFQTGFIAIFTVCVLGFLTSLMLEETPVWTKATP